jgi:hypothetical protein
MAFWTDISGDMNGSAGARAVHVATGQGDLFVLVECSEPDLPAGAVQVQEALAALVSGIACSSASSPFRALDLAFLHANRAVYRSGLNNPAARDLLVSASAVYCSEGALHFASVGANAIYLREGDSTVGVVVPETEANRLVSEGITADPIPGFGGVSGASPSQGLGLPPEVFKVRQTGTRRVADDFLLVLCGGRAAQFTTSAHVQTLSPGGEDARTANRLFHQVRHKSGGGTAILAAHKALDFQTADIPHPFEAEMRSGSAAALWVLVAVVLAAGAAVAIYASLSTDSGDGSQGARVLPPTRLLPPKHESAVVPDSVPGGSPLTDVVSGSPDFSVPAAEVRTALADSSGVFGDLAEARAPAKVAAKPTRARRKGKKKKIRKPRKKTRSAATTVAKTVDKKTVSPPGLEDVVFEIPDAVLQQEEPQEEVREAAPEEGTGGDTRGAPIPPEKPSSEPEIQVMDFTQPDAEAGEADVRPGKRAFPAAKLGVDIAVQPAAVEADPDHPSTE